MTTSGRPAARRGRRVGFYGVLGSGNLGNDASLDVVVRHLRVQDPDADVGFFAMGHEELSRRYGGPGTPLQWYEAHREALPLVPDLLLKIVGRLLDPVRTWRWVRGCDVVVVPGMGVLEATTPVRPWGAPWGILSLAVAARLTGTPLALLCVGVESGRDPVVRWMFRTTARLASYRSYRDELSRDAARGLGVDVGDDAVFPDLVLGLPPHPTHRDARLVGVGLMNYRGRAEDRGQADELHARYTQRMGSLVRRLVDEGWRVRLLVGDVEDVPVADRVADLADASHTGRVAIAATATMAELLEALADAHVVIATRYHNVLAALALGTPTISLGYARKNDVLMSLFGLAEYCQPVGALDVDRAVAQFHSVVDRYDELERGLEGRLPEIRRRAQHQLTVFSGRFLAGISAQEVAADVH
jgi:polysaccharide pyruvyl transferase WcaK-like protein